MVATSNIFGMFTSDLGISGWFHSQVVRCKCSNVWVATTRMSRWKLGSMVRINGLFHLRINGVYWGYNPLILTIDPNFQRDILVKPCFYPTIYGLRKNSATYSDRWSLDRCWETVYPGRSGGAFKKLILPLKEHTLRIIGPSKNEGFESV